MIAIITPYNRCEATTAAIRLGDLALSLGHTCQLVLCGRSEGGIHPYWDKEVLKTHGPDELYSAVRQCSSVVHMLSHPGIYDLFSSMTSYNREAARQIVVPSWNAFHQEIVVESLSSYDRIVCPSKASHEMVSGLLDPKFSPGNCTWCRWDPGIAFTPKRGTVAPGRIRACVYCDASAIDYCGAMIIGLVADLLGAHRMLDVTVLSIKSWSRHDRTEWRNMQRIGGRRLSLQSRPTLPELNRIFHAHDWTVVPAVRGDFGVAAARSLTCGTPVIANAVAPFSEIVTDRFSGLLVPCELRGHTAGAPLAVPAIGNWLAACGDAFSSTDLLLELQGKNWNLGARKNAFDAVWRDLWSD